VMDAEKRHANGSTFEFSHFLSVSHRLQIGFRT
jgi:hypothetical protein